MAIERDIHRLLFIHDCVVVPEFGGFLTHYRPARLDGQRNVVLPPAKDLSFNRKLTRTDGLLAQEVMRREGLDHAAAAKCVAACSLEWRNVLDRTGRLELEQVGTFYFDADRTLRFAPDEHVNFLRDAHGLRPLAVVPAVSQAVGKERRASGGRPWLWAAATLALLSTAGTWWYIGGDALDPAMAWLKRSKHEEKTRYIPVAHAGFGPASLRGTDAWAPPVDGRGVLALPIAGADGPIVAVDLGDEPLPERSLIEEEVAAAVAVPESTAVAVRTPGLRFHIIGGCFREHENAARFVSELQARGFNASVVDRKGGLYRVAYGSYAERAAASEALNAVRKEEGASAWLLVH